MWRTDGRTNGQKVYNTTGLGLKDCSDRTTADLIWFDLIWTELNWTWSGSFQFSYVQFSFDKMRWDARWEHRFSSAVLMRNNSKINEHNIRAGRCRQSAKLNIFLVFFSRIHKTLRSGWVLCACSQYTDLSCHVTISSVYCTMSSEIHQRYRQADGRHARSISARALESCRPIDHEDNTTIALRKTSPVQSCMATNNGTIYASD